MALNVPQAVRLIPYYANSVGWRDDWGRISRLLGFNIAPADPAIFVTAVYKWQLSHHLDADGMVGSDTWKKMKPILPSSYVGPIPAWAASIDIPEIKVFVRSKETNDQFVAGCNRARGKVQTASLQFSAWLSGIALAYGTAFEQHNKFRDEMKTAVKIADGLVLGYALAFLGGGVGGVVGAAMKKAEMGDFMIDGIKDLAKWYVRAPAGQALHPPSVKAMPQSPGLWQNAINERVMLEMAAVSKQIDDWSGAVDDKAVDDNGNPTLDVTFDASFDPVMAVESALVLRGPDGEQMPIKHLAPVDKDSLQVDFEKGWLVGWIELGQATHIPAARAYQRDKCNAYGRKLGLANIKELVDEHIPNEENPMTRGVGVIGPL